MCANPVRNSGKQGRLHVLLVVLVSLLVFVWPIPNTISLRDLLLVVVLSLSGYLAYCCHVSREMWHTVRIPLGFYFVLSAWILIVALFVSSETAWSLAEIKGQWLKATVALVAGALTGGVALHNSRFHHLILFFAVFALLAHIFYIDAWSVIQFARDDRLPKYVVGLTEGSDKSSYLTNMLFCFLLAEAVIRISNHQRVLPVNHLTLGALIGVTLFSAHVEGMRNGVIELGFILFIAGTIFMVNRHKRFSSASVMTVFVIMIVTLSFLNVRNDSRWQSFWETVPIALDTENLAWTNILLPQPRLSDGQTVDWSNYSRIARIKAGIEIVKDNPLGVGFGRNAFGHAVKAKYGLETSHSHSGFIDLAVGIGVPGAMLWVLFLGSLWLIGYRGASNNQFEGLVLLFLVSGFGLRMILDSTVRDHMLQMFLFLGAMLAVLVARAQVKVTPDTSENGAT